MVPNSATPRAFMRHPATVPIELAADAPAGGGPLLVDISEGGLACQSATPFEPGALVRITIPCVSPPFEAPARVVWCHRHGGAAHELGLQFLVREDAFVARMVEQVCHIEEYRREVRESEGREIDADTAAREWIGKHGASFPRPDHS